MLLAEAIASMGRELRRVAPMAAGIVWGVASVFVLVAVARGFEGSQRAALDALGDGFMLLRVNRATTTRGDVRSGAFVLLEGEDMVAARVGSPSSEAISPKANNWFIRAIQGGETSRVIAVGVEPEYRRIVHVPLEPGSRWIDQHDLDQEVPVCVLGYRARDELFPDGRFLGREITLVFQRDAGEDTVLRRLTVIGALQDEELASDEIYTSHRNVVFLPFTTWERMSPRGFQFFVVKPRSPELREQVLAELREVLGRRHGFDPANTNTLIPYFDAIARGQQIDAVFGGLRFFLAAVGVLILMLGAVGVANVVLMSVAARGYEFGLRRALGCKRRWIFAQVFLEAGAVCLASGLIGFGLGLLGVRVMSVVDMPAGFAAPQAELGAAALPGALLLVVTVLAATWPAARAVRASVVDALHGGRL